MLTSAELHQWLPATRISPQPPGRGLFDQAERHLSILKLRSRAVAMFGRNQIELVEITGIKTACSVTGSSRSRFCESGCMANCLNVLETCSRGEGGGTVGLSGRRNMEEPEGLHFEAMASSRPLSLVIVLAWYSARHQLSCCCNGAGI
jgi:hypothetical protein